MYVSVCVRVFVCLYVSLCVRGFVCVGEGGIVNKSDGEIERGKRVESEEFGWKESEKRRKGGDGKEGERGKTRCERTRK